MATDRWSSKTQKEYSYRGKVVKAVNKPEAARLLGVTAYPEIAKIKRVKV